VRVPDEAVTGKAKMKMSFDAWKEGRVTPGTAEILIADAKPRAKAAAAKR
jgi:hypothetical protein